MAIAGEWSWLSESDDDKVSSLCRFPSGSPRAAAAVVSAVIRLRHCIIPTLSQPPYSAQRLGNGEGKIRHPNSVTVSSIAKSLLPPRRRLHPDPSNKRTRKAGQKCNYHPEYMQISGCFQVSNNCPKELLYAPSRWHPCSGRNFGGLFKFVEPPESNEKPVDQKSRVKFKIMSLKVSGDQLDYVPEMFEEQRDQVSVEQILLVVFLDAERPSQALEKLKGQLAEADAAVETRRKPQEDADPRIRERA